MSLTSRQLGDPPQGPSSSQPTPSTADAVQYKICLRVSEGKMGLMVGLGKSTIAFCLSRQRRLESETTLPVFYRDIASLFRSVQIARRHSESTGSSGDAPPAATKALCDAIQSDYLPSGRFVVHDDWASFRDALKGGLQLQPRLGHSAYEGLACVEDDPAFGRGRAGISLMVDLHDKPEELIWQIREIGEKLSDRYSEELRSEYHNSDLRDAKAILLSVPGYLTEDISDTQWAELAAARERDLKNGTVGYHSEGSALRARWLEDRWRAMRTEEGASLGSLKIRMYSDAQVCMDARRAASIMVGESSSLDPSLTPAPRGLDVEAEDDDEGTL